MAFWRRSFPVDLAEEGRFSRREFARFLALVSAGFTAGLAWLWLRKTPLAGPPAPAGAGPVPLGLAADLRPSQSRLFAFRGPQDRCIVLRTPLGELRAYRQACTHLGCAVRFRNDELQCPCHEGVFEIEHGFPIQGPPTRPLSRVALEVRADGTLWAVGDLPAPTGFPSRASAACPRQAHREEVA